jgi:alpha,alpha-trehalase
LDRAEKELHQELDSIPGAQIERKRFSIAVHYRNVAEENVEEIHHIVKRIVDKKSSLALSSGKKVFELQPDIDWDKGKVVLWLLTKLNLKGSDVISIYLGDDLTDENAFRALTQKGITMLVGNHGHKTSAQYGLKNVKEVKEFLSKIKSILEEM